MNKIVLVPGAGHICYVGQEGSRRLLGPRDGGLDYGSDPTLACGLTRTSYLRAEAAAELLFQEAGWGGDNITVYFSGGRDYGEPTDSVFMSAHCMLALRDELCNAKAETADLELLEKIQGCIEYDDLPEDLKDPRAGPHTTFGNVLSTMNHFGPRLYNADQVSVLTNFDHLLETCELFERLTGIAPVPRSVETYLLWKAEEKIRDGVKGVYPTRQVKELLEAPEHFSVFNPETRGDALDSLAKGIALALGGKTLFELYAHYAMQREGPDMWEIWRDIR